MLDNGFTMEDVVKAGYFEDNFHDREIMRIPFGKPKKDKRIIIGMSGCFSPMHEGHVHALELTKDYFIRAGYVIVRAIIFPAHDSYVSIKRGGEAKCDIQTRLKQIREFIEQNGGWIDVDDFPATQLPNEVNFPFLIDRLQSYGELFEAETAFVVGGDNSHFAYAFSNSKTKIVCVDRENKIELDKSRLINVDYHEISENKYHQLSSSSIRKAKSLSGQG